MTLVRLAAAIVSMSPLVSAGAARADIKDYEVLRFLYLRTPCGMASVTSRNATPESVRFTADCQNRTAFPDGATVVCTDHNDDRTCRVETPARAFEQLHLLRPNPQQPD